jgi:hypothetical protein
VELLVENKEEGESEPDDWSFTFSDPKSVMSAPVVYSVGSSFPSLSSCSSSKVVKWPSSVQIEESIVIVPESKNPKFLFLIMMIDVDFIIQT